MNTGDVYGHVLSMADAIRLGVFSAARAISIKKDKPIEILTAADIGKDSGDNMGLLDDAKDLYNGAKELGKSLAPEAQSIAATSNNVKEYMDATSKTPPTAKATPAQGDPPSLRKAAKYGDRPGEKRIDVSSWTKPLTSYHTGTKFVPETGPANLEKGEAVIPKDANPFSKVMEMANDKAPKKTIKEIRSRRTKDGKYLHEHHHTDPSHPMEEHISANNDELSKHMIDHLGQAPEGAEPAPQM